MPRLISSLNVGSRKDSGFPRDEKLLLAEALPPAVLLIVVGPGDFGVLGAKGLLPFKSDGGGGGYTFPVPSALPL